VLRVQPLAELPGEHPQGQDDEILGGRHLAEPPRGRGTFPKDVAIAVPSAARPRFRRAASSNPRAVTRFGSAGIVRRARRARRRSGAAVLEGRHGGTRMETPGGGGDKLAAGRRQSIESTQFLSPLSRERWDATESRNSIDSSGAGRGHTKESSGQQSAISGQRANGQLGKTEGRDRWNRAFREREIEGLSGLPYSNRPKQRLLATRSSMRDVGRLLFLSRTQAPWCILRA
jgi:hypothetical protein